MALLLIMLVIASTILSAYFIPPHIVFVVQVRLVFVVQVRQGFPLLLYWKQFLSMSFMSQ